MRSTDAGQTWALAWSPAATLFDVTSPSIHHLVGVGAISATVGTVYRSADNGISWDSLKLGTNGYLRAVCFASPDTGFSFSTGGTVYRTCDGGMTWDSITTLPVEATVGNIAVLDPRTIYFSGVRGNVLRSSSGVTGTVRDLPLPLSVALDQNYPNPFNPSTTISFGLPNRSHVTLTAFNMLGQQVSVLESGDMDAGYHHVRFDGSNLPSGVYFYRLQVRPSDSVLGRDSRGGAGAYTATKRLLLLR